MTLIDFYLNEWKGSFDGEAGADGLKLLLSRASDVVNNRIYLSGYTVETAPETLKTAVYKAVCAQADYIEYNGGADAMSDNGDMSSVSLGKFSYSGGSQGGSSARSTSQLCEQATAYLRTTGLLYRGARAI